MIEKPKTKHTPVGEIPTEWQCRKLSSVASVQTGISKSAKRTLRDPVELPYLRVANVQDGHFDLTEVKTIRISRSDIERFSLRAGDVLLTEGGDFDKLGRGHVWNGAVDPCLHQNHVFAVRLDRAKLLPYYLASFTSCPAGRRYFLSCSKQTTNLASINSTQLKAMPVPIPPLPEQRKIAEILSTWDRAIERTEKLIDAKERLKKGLMQRLLTGELRFAEFRGTPWRTYRLGDLLRRRNERMPRNGDVPLYSLTIEDGVTPKTDRYNREFLVKNTGSKKYKVIHPGDIAFNPSNLRWGAIALSRLVGAVLVSPIYEVVYPRTGTDCDVEFLIQRLSWEEQIKRFDQIAEGTLVERTAVNIKAFFKCQIQMPSVAEQRRIAQVLSTIDREVLVLQDQVNALQQQKKGLMQKLLTGKVRVEP